MNIYEIDKSISNLIDKFEKISKMGWILKETTNDGEAGNNMEKLLGLNTNDFQIPDYEGIEIKTKKHNGYNNFITLFNCIPQGNNFFEIQRIKETYGYPDKDLKEFKVFNGDVYCNKKNKVGALYSFCLDVSKENGKINLLVYSDKNKLIDSSSYWNIENLKEIFSRKNKYMAIITVESKTIKRQKYYKYTQIKILKAKDFECFIKSLVKGFIKIQFKIGVYKKGKALGRTHDRGTGFLINLNHINELYETIYESNNKK